MAEERLKQGEGPVTLHSTLGSATAIPYAGIAAMIYLSAAATVTFYGCRTKDGTYVALNRRTSADTDWTAFEAVAMTVTAAGWYPVPDECSPFPFIKGELDSGSMADAEFQPTS